MSVPDWNWRLGRLETGLKRYFDTHEQTVQTLIDFINTGVVSPPVARGGRESCSRLINDNCHIQWSRENGVDTLRALIQGKWKKLYQTDKTSVRVTFDEGGGNIVTFEGGLTDWTNDYIEVAAVNTNHIWISFDSLHTFESYTDKKQRERDEDSPWRKAVDLVQSRHTSIPFPSAVSVPLDKQDNLTLALHIAAMAETDALASSVFAVMPDIAGDAGADKRKTIEDNTKAVITATIQDLCTVTSILGSKCDSWETESNESLSGAFDEFYKSDKWDSDRESTVRLLRDFVLLTRFVQMLTRQPRDNQTKHEMYEQLTDWLRKMNILTPNGQLNPGVRQWQPFCDFIPTLKQVCSTRLDKIPNLDWGDETDGSEGVPRKSRRVDTGSPKGANPAAKVQLMRDAAFIGFVLRNSGAGP